MIIGTHVMIQSKDAAADMAFMRDVLKFPVVDAGGGFMIYGVPATDLAVHTSTENDKHQLYLMCDDVKKLVAQLSAKRIGCGPIQELGWGSLTEITLFGGGKLSAYQPHHPRPPHPGEKAPSPVAADSGPRACAHDLLGVGHLLERGDDGQPGFTHEEDAGIEKPARPGQSQHDGEPAGGRPDQGDDRDADARGHEEADREVERGQGGSQQTDSRGQVRELAPDESHAARVRPRRRARAAGALRLGREHANAIHDAADAIGRGERERAPGRDQHGGSDHGS